MYKKVILKKLFILSLINMGLSSELFFGINSNNYPKIESSANNESLRNNSYGTGSFIAYNYPIYQSPLKQIKIDIGISYNLVNPIDYSKTELISFYTLRTYSFKKYFKLWVPIGLSLIKNNKIEQSFRDLGTIYGLGFNYNIEGNFSIGLGYIINSHPYHDIKLKIKQKLIFIAYSL